MAATTPQQKALDTIFKRLEKKHGDAVTTMAAGSLGQVRGAVPSPLTALNRHILGVGGFAFERITEVYGPESSGKSSLVMGCLAAVQKSGGIGFYIDAENACTQERAEVLGVDKEQLLMAPELDNAEHAGQILLDTIIAHTSEVPLLAVYDSVPAMETKAQSEGDVGDAYMSPMARMLSAFMPKLIKALRGKNSHVIFVNQVREKPGVMYGCFHGDTKVTFVDGTQVPISKVVAERLEGPVLSWDGKRITERKIVNWFDNGPLPDEENWLTFRVAGAGGLRGAQGFTCTRNHRIVTADGKEVSAGELRVGDALLSWFEARLSPAEKEIVYGSLLGDGHLHEKGFLQLANTEQPDYLRWKLANLPSLGFARYLSGGRECFKSQSEYELRLLRSVFYRGSKGYRTAPVDVIRDSGPLTLAVWYMDDGSFKSSHKSAAISVKRLSASEGEAAAEALALRFPGVNYSESQQAVVIPVSAFAAFSQFIAGYVHPSMSYKLLEEDRKRAGTSVLEHQTNVLRVPTAVRILGIKESKKKRKWRTRFDIQVEGDAHYLVGGDSRGVIVHNSPEYTPGGKAIKFYATARLRTSRVKERDGGIEVKIKSVKNKLAEPQREIHAFLHFQKGWDDKWTTLNYAKDASAVSNSERNEDTALEALGWTAKEAAERFGAAPTTLAKVELQPGEKIDLAEAKRKTKKGKPS